MRAVVWVTLREQRSYFRPINDRIRAAARGGGPGGLVVRLADWNAYSAGRRWFAADGLHLNATGALGLAVLSGAVAGGDGRGGCLPPGPSAASLVPLRTSAARIAGDPGVLWVEETAAA